MLNKVREFKKEAKGAKATGFTIIEVMIVLAIAGLIMAIVFVAIPQLQRNTRNTTAKDVLNRVKAEMDSYSTNNNGNYPKNVAEFGNVVGGAAIAAGTSFTSHYLSNVGVTDPKTGTPFGFNFIASGTFTLPIDVTAPATARVVNYYYNAKCSGETVILGSGTAVASRNYAMAVYLEGGAIYCADNQ